MLVCLNTHSIIYNYTLIKLPVKSNLPNKEKRIAFHFSESNIAKHSMMSSTPKSDLNTQVTNTFRVMKLRQYTLLQDSRLQTLNFKLIYPHIRL